MSGVNTSEVEITGDVVEWQTLLSGMQIVSLEGASADGTWTLSGGCSWNIRAGSEASEGDLTLSRDGGAELFATLSTGTVVELPSDAAEAADYDVRLELTIDGGAGAFASASGVIDANGRLSRQGFSLHLRISVNDT